MPIRILRDWDAMIVGGVFFYMAKDKKSFVLYCDQKGIWDKLDDAQAGKLIKHIIAYVNDEGPTAPDFVTELAFESIKQQLKRDLKKWEDQLNQRIDAGKKSAEIRKRNAAAVNGRSISSTVNVTVNDNVNVTDKINKLSPTGDGFEFEKSILSIIQQLRADYLNSPVEDYKVSPKRISQIKARKREFDKLWPGRDFYKACKFAFEYKAKQWFGTDTFAYFKPDTLLSNKFVEYLEDAKQNDGKPYKAEPKRKEEEVIKYPSLKN